MMLAVPAELEWRKAVCALLVMLALPAVLEFWNCSAQLLMILALPPPTLIPAPVKLISLLPPIVNV